MSTSTLKRIWLLPVFGLLSACIGTKHAPATNDTQKAQPANQAAVPSPQLIPATGEQILAAVRNADAAVVLVSVWATWCQPCREEFPDLVRLQRDYNDRGLKVLFVSADFDTEVQQAAEFLAEHGVDFPSYIKSGNDMAFIDALNPEWSGALPATFIYDWNRILRHFWVGKASYATFEEKIQHVLQD